MQPQYKHLNEDVMAEISPGVWIPDIPLPFYGSLRRFLSFTRYYECGCGVRSWTETEYQLHYRTEQLLEMNKIHATSRSLQHGKVMFWRRAFYVMRHGTDLERKRMLRDFDINGYPEAVGQKRIDTLNNLVTDHWKPVYDREGRKRGGTIRQALNAAAEDVEDETPEEAARDMDTPFTWTNSRGVTYYLNAKKVALRGGKLVEIWYFTKDYRPDTAKTTFPDDCVINENPRNGFLTVHRRNDVRDED